MSNFFGTVKTNNSVTDIEAPVYEGYIAPTSSALLEIATESVVEGLQLQAALHVADASIAYTAVHESTEQAEAIFESVVGSTFGKIKDGLKKLWAKMKAWFKSVAKSFQMAFTSGKDFVKKFKKEIESKTAAGFEYQGHVWTIDQGNNKAQELLNSIQGVVSSTLKSADSISPSMKTDDLKDKYELSELREQIVTAVGGKLGLSGSSVDLSEIKEALAKAYRGGSDEKVELKEFAKVSRGTLIDLIEKVDKNKKFIDDAEKAVDKQFSESIKTIDKLEKALGKAADSDYGNGDVSSRRAKITTVASAVGNLTRYGQSLNSTIAATAVESVKASAKEAESVLKSFLRFKGVKESYGSDLDNPDQTDVLESFLNCAKF